MFQLDKLAHLIVYALLYILWAYGERAKYPERRFFPVILVACMAYGILLELLQSQMYLGRHFDVLDIIANIIGLLIAYVAIGKVLK